MAKILSISSEVIRGHVGHAASRFVLQRLGHDVWAFPTILLSNHPGHEKFSGEPTDPAHLEKMRDSLDGNGWLGEIDAVFTGYLPSAEHAEFAVETVRLVKSRSPNAKVLTDPAFGDDPKGLYIDEGAAAKIDSDLLPLADFVTPNRFELGWLAQAPVITLDEARRAAKEVDFPVLLATSIPGDADGALCNLLVEEQFTMTTTVKRRHAAPHGTGDMMAALFLGHFLNEKSSEEAMARATGAVEIVLQASDGTDELALIPTQELWVNAEPWPVERIG